MRISDWSSDVCSSDLDGLGADEAAFEVGVDDAGGLRRLGALLDRPGPRFLRPRREEGDEVEELVAGADDAGKAGFLQPQILQELGPVGRVHGRDLGFYCGGDDEGPVAVGLALPAHPRTVGIDSTPQATVHAIT